LLSPTDDNSLVNISDFSKIGLSSLKDSSSFKKIQYHSKSPASQLFDSSTVNYSKFDVLSALYNHTSSLNNSKDYYTDRQDNYSSLLVNQLNSSSNLEHNSVSKALDYNFSLNNESAMLNSANGSLNLSSKGHFNDSNSASSIGAKVSSTNLSTDVNSKLLDLSKNSLNINATSDGKYYNNPLKAILSPTNSRKLALSLPVTDSSDLSVNLSLSEVNNKFSNIEASSKFKELKSGNMGFLSPDKSSRLVGKLHSSKGQFNFSHESSNLSDILNNISNQGSVVSESEVYGASNMD